MGVIYNLSIMTTINCAWHAVHPCILLITVHFVLFLLLTLISLANLHIYKHTCMQLYLNCWLCNQIGSLMNVLGG